MARFYVSEQLSEHIGETPEGFLLCKDVPLTRIGEFDYTAAEVPVEGGMDGVVKIQRDEDEVFSEKAIASFEGKPLVLNHPDGVVTPENWKKLSHGYVQNVRRGDGEMKDLLLGDILVNTKEAIELVKSGLREVSLGYDAEYEQIEKGRGRQSNIVGNHVALVTKGRAGSRCAIQDEDSVNNNIITREDVNTMTAKELFKRIFPKSRFADSLEDADLGEPSSVEGADDAERAAQAAAEAKEAAEQAVAAAEQASEAAQAAENNSNGGEEGKVEDQEEGGEAESGSGDISERLARLESLIERLLELVGEDNSSEDEETVSKEDEEKEEAVESEEKETADEDEEGWEEEDDEEFQEIAGDAEIIDPDIMLSKPTGDKAAYYNKVRRAALARALTSDNAAIISPLLKGKNIKSLKPAELKGVFVAASRMIAATRDSKVQRKSMDSSGYFKQANSEIEKMIAKNKEFWGKK